MWIDAVCVDQENLEERSQQVQRMAEIYKLADRVVVWLGESDSQTVFAMNLLSYLASQIEIDWKQEAMKPASQRGTCEDWADDTKVLPYGKEELNAIDTLVRRSCRCWGSPEFPI